MHFCQDELLAMLGIGASLKAAWWYFKARYGAWIAAHRTNTMEGS